MGTWGILNKRTEKGKGVEWGEEVSDAGFGAEKGGNVERIGTKFKIVDSSTFTR